MNKEELYQQIQKFNNTLTDEDNLNSDSFQEARFYVNDEEAIDKAQFINYLIKEKYLNQSYSNILDMTFGSGNLTSHIIFDNEISYEKLTLNDINTENTNQEIKDYIDNCMITDYDILEKTIMSTFAVDLVVLNPQIGGSYPKGDITKQKKEKETTKQLLERLYKNIEIYLNIGATVAFYGEEKDFIALFGECTCLRYKSDSKQLYVVNNKLDKTICFEKNNTKFEEIDCNDNDSENDDIVENFDELSLELDDFNFSEEDVKEDKNILQFSDEVKGDLTFKYKNILFKGVPGTGKSRAIDKIIDEHLDIKEEKRNILRVNIHSASSNSDLMQGIGISSDKGNIKYSEKQGLILDIIKRATFHPNQPFVLILEEIQENSLNELIGDLIYLIEEDKRSKLTADNEEYDSYEVLVNKLVEDKTVENYVEIPYLVDDSTDYKKMIMPNNLYIFCTSNYRDDKKVIEDNLLRRFEVIEIYPNETVPNDYVKEFFKELNKSILKEMKDNHEIHPDRFMIGHAIWKDVKDKKLFYKAFSKLITEFKDIREIEYNMFKTIVKDLPFPDDIEIDIQDNYYELIKDIQSKINYGFID